MLTLNWLLESIQQRQPVSEREDFLYKIKTNKAAELDVQDAPSPASKKNIMSMNHSSGTFKAPRKKLSFNETENNRNIPNKAARKSDEIEDMVLDQYLAVESRTNVTITSPVNDPVKSPTTSTSPQVSVPLAKPSATTAAPPPAADSESRFLDSQMSSSEFTQNLDFLTNMKVSIIGFDTESSELLVHYCRAAGADVIDNIDQSVDYLIVSVDKMTLDDVHVRARFVVNSNWLVSI